MLSRADEARRRSLWGSADDAVQSANASASVAAAAAHGGCISPERDAAAAAAARATLLLSWQRFPRRRWGAVGDTPDSPLLLFCIEMFAETSPTRSGRPGLGSQAFSGCSICDEGKHFSCCRVRKASLSLEILSTPEGEWNYIFVIT